MQESTFPEVIERQVMETATQFGVTKDRAFLIWAGSRVLGIDDEDAYSAALVGGANDLGLDFGWIGDSEQQVVLAQGKYTDAVDRATIRSLIALPEILMDPKATRERSANRQVLNFGRAFRAAVRSGGKVRLILFHLGELAQPTKSELQGKVEDFGSGRLQEVFEDKSPITFGQTPDRVDLAIENDSFFRLDDRPGRARCYVAKVPLTELHKLFVRYRAGLLDRNVRLHVGAQTAANKGMSTTLKDETQRANFFFYNNGLCILSERIEKPLRSGQNSIIGLHRPQIVNGGQTYYTVGQLDEDQLEGAAVLARIICPSVEKKEEFIDNVIRFNNTQTPVTSRDFHSNDLIQRNLFDKFSHLNPPWFYERKEGLWESLDAKFQSRFRRTSGRARSCFRIIDNELFAQCKLAWQGEPAIAKTQKKRIFDDDASQGGIYSRVFPPGCDSDEEVGIALVAYRLNEVLGAERAEWAKKKREAAESGDTDKLEKLERDGFVPFLNFFALASIKYVMDKYVKDRDPSVLLSPTPFKIVYDFILMVFHVRIQVAQQAAVESNRAFSLSNWFKSNDNFKTAICQTIDSMAHVLQKDKI